MLKRVEEKEEKRRSIAFEIKATLQARLDRPEPGSH